MLMLMLQRMLGRGPAARNRPRPVFFGVCFCEVDEVLHALTLLAQKPPDSRVRPLQGAVHFRDR
jgi:hypothetical protein